MQIDLNGFGSMIEGGPEYTYEFLTRTIRRWISKGRKSRDLEAQNRYAGSLLGRNVGPTPSVAAEEGPGGALDSQNFSKLIFNIVKLTMLVL